LNAVVWASENRGRSSIETNGGLVCGFTAKARLLRESFFAADSEFEVLILDRAFSYAVGFSNKLEVGVGGRYAYVWKANSGEDERCAPCENGFAVSWNILEQ
jgi:predicted 3-demethylubiquinone-9 3-methyltransferase (glyoxalase superfamily)